MSEKTETQKQRKWNSILNREHAKATSAEKEGMETVEHEGVVALAGEVEQDDDEWVVMEDCPDDLQLGQ